MHLSRDIDGADFDDRRLHVDDGVLVDPIVDAQRAPRGIVIPSFARFYKIVITFSVAVGPVLGAAYAMAVPPLHRPPAARSLVILPRPLVVKFCQVIQHSLADLGRRALLFQQQSGVAPKQVVDDGGEAKSRAGAFLSL